AILDEANFEGATFWHANLAGASIYKICEAQTKGADFAGAHFERNSKCANFEDTNLASVKNLTWEQIKNTFGNKNSVPPEGVELPWKWM
ncbi:MAG TPA: pentapeptide repeat-containing protein, partial [Candidatus Limnocylindria bacterium]|nr:pentapeptide repeat-containing protein [Candidatus Limnocylindria bacterium]